MPTIINPYKSGGTMGEDLFGLGGLADAFFGPKASTAAYTREKFKEASRQNLNVPLYADAVAGGGDPGNIARLGILSGQTGQDVANYGRYVTTNRNPNDLTGNTVTASALGAGTPFAATAQGDAAHLANTQTIAQMQADKAAATQNAIDARSLVPVVGTDGKTTYAQKSQAAGMGAPVTFDQARGRLLETNFGTLDTLNPFQRSAVSADASMGNWFVRDTGTGKIQREGRTLDGKTDAATGLPLHPSAVVQQSSNPGGANAFQSPATELGKTEQRSHREAIGNADQVLNLGAKITDIVTRNPTAIGPVGNLRLLGQEGLDLLNSLNMQFGGGQPGGYDAAVAQTRNELRRKFGAGAAQLLPELFDSDLNSVRTMNGMLVYKAAAALGQSGRDASDKDIGIVKSLTGDPASWFQGPNTYKDKIKTLTDIIAQQRDEDFKMLQPGAVIGPRVGAPTAPAPGGTGAPAAAPVDVDALVNKYRSR
jgi:hypothetical protein